MKKPRIAIVTFPGTNGDTENLRAFWRCGFDVFVFRWNDSREKLAEVDGYFIGAGFSYEDRGRSGMVAARDPLFQHLNEEAARGKVVIGSCNGAQVLVESGLIPLGDGLRMSLARNAIRDQKSETSDQNQWYSPGFLNEWIWIKRTCAHDRCAPSDWDGVMHIPMAHGEGRFVTRNPELIAALEESDQIAFRYCDEEGNVSDDPSVTLNGSTNAIAGICNPAGNVVALMPHPERTVNGDPYFLSIKKWIETHGNVMPSSAANTSIRPSMKPVPSYAEGLGTTRDDPSTSSGQAVLARIEARSPKPVEIFIDTIIVNNEERTVEQAARRVVPSLRLKQYRYLAPTEKSPETLLTTISLFNPNKELAFVRMGSGSDSGQWFHWSATRRALEQCKVPQGFRGSEPQSQPESFVLIRRDEPDTEASGLGKGSETGICYVLQGVSEQNLCSNDLQEIFANPHASTLEIGS